MQLKYCWIFLNYRTNREKDNSHTKQNITCFFTDFECRYKTFLNNAYIKFLYSIRTFYSLFNCNIKVKTIVKVIKGFYH